MGLRSPRQWTGLSRVGADLSALTSRHSTVQVVGADGLRFARGEGAFGVRPDLSFLMDNLIAPSPGTGFSALGRIVGEFVSPAGRNVVLQRQLNGHDVYGVILKVHDQPVGIAITGDVDRDLHEHIPTADPRLRSDAAVRLAQALLPGESSVVSDPELVIFPLPGAGRWAWLVSLIANQPVANVRALVDAQTGKILLSFNRASALNGKAEVFPVNPARGGLTRVELVDLSLPPGDALRGASIEVQPGSSRPFTNAARDFIASPSSPQFDEAACYYHLTQGLDYFGRFYDMASIAAPPFRPIRAIVNDPFTRGNARFVPDTALLRFGGGRTPWARSGEIVVHELGHAVTHAVARLADSPARSQCRGLSEGYSDYFASSLYGDPRFGDYVAPGHERNCSDPSLRFRAGFKGDEHDTGAVWAAVLWELRQSIGPADADRLVAQSVAYLMPFGSFLDGLEALCTADRALAGGPAVGPNEALIRRAFTNRI